MHHWRPGGLGVMTSRLHREDRGFDSPPGYSFVPFSSVVGCWCLCLMDIAGMLLPLIVRLLDCWIFSFSGLDCIALEVAGYPSFFSMDYCLRFGSYQSILVGSK